MHAALLEILACPRCGSDLRLDPHSVAGDEVRTGTLTCEDCASEYGVEGGVPLMNVGLDGLESVARSFGYEWHAHHRGVFEHETLFGRTTDEDWQLLLDTLGAVPSGLEGALVLDAGCGSGRFTRLLAEHGAALAVGVDINDAVHDARAATAIQPSVEIVQANIFALPFRPGSFDYVWCSGSSTTFRTRRRPSGNWPVTPAPAGPSASGSTPGASTRSASS